jgi:hypothetical protein
MLTIYIVDYLSKFGAVFMPLDSENNAVKDMVSILIRIIFSFTCTFGGGISLLKPKWTSYLLCTAYSCFTILVQIVNFYGLSWYEDLEPLALFKTRI